jgi:CubicO group peptidase (beta-lactamase class C family)
LGDLKMNIFFKIAKTLMITIGVLALTLGVFGGWQYYKWVDISALEEFKTMAELDEMITKLVADESVPGLAVAIVANGDVAWSKGYGMANIKGKRPVTPDTPFMIGSISKVYTGVGIMQAVEQGHLSLDTNINDYLSFKIDNPYLEDEIITLRHLATHTSGIVNNDMTANAAYVVGDTTVSLTQYLKDNLVAGGKSYDARVNFTKHKPGTSFSYSNIGASLAGDLLEATTGISLDTYTQDHIFDKLGMKNTGWHLRDFEDLLKIATPYNQGVWPWAYGEEVQKDIPYFEETSTFGTHGFLHSSSPSYPMGGLRSSVNDQGRFLAAIMNNGELDGVRIIEEATLEMMFELQIPGVKIDDDEVKRQGLFWAMDMDGLWGHTGGDLGANNIMFFDPESKVGGVISLNLGPTLISLAVRQRVLHQIMDNPDKINKIFSH